ncbi:AMP-binding protein [Streptomyces sp. NPDC050560]|uniref:AMP-binding protein n=1 Tax=Streptomyces sp. NPDC050560 TaxID=3365630 RepID=UPI0037B55810
MTGRPVPPAAGGPSKLVERVRDVMALHPHARAVTDEQRTLHYRELDELRTAWSKRLGERGAPPGSIVALAVHDPLYLAPAFLAARTAGLVPLLLDPHQPAARRAAVLAAARPALTMRVGETPSYETSDEAPLVVGPGAGYLGFTSGTQGTPKGIVGNELGALHFADWEIGTLGLRSGTRVALLSPPTFEVIIRELFVTLCAGGELLVAQPGVRADPSRVVDWIATREAELVHAVPSLSIRWVAAAAGRRLPGLRWTLFAGEPLYAEHVLRWRGIAPSTDVINLYGPSETTLAKFWYRVPDPPKTGLQPVGRPLPGAGLRGAVPGGASFPVVVETPHGSLGYLPGTAAPADEAALTRSAGMTAFVSKDLGLLTDDGDLVVTGRSDSQVKRRGVFVDLGRIEEAAADSPGVRLACCVQADPGNGGALVLFVESAPELPVARLSRHLRRELGPAAPDDVVAVPRMPLSPNGKIDRRIVGRLVNGPLGEPEPEPETRTGTTRIKTETSP